MATPSSFSSRPSCGACTGRPRTPTSWVRASGQGDGVTQRPPDGVVAEKLECTLVCILTRSLVTVAAAEQGVREILYDEIQKMLHNQLLPFIFLVKFKDH